MDLWPGHAHRSVESSVKPETEPGTPTRTATANRTELLVGTLYDTLLVCFLKLSQEVSMTIIEEAGPSEAYNDLLFNYLNEKTSSSLRQR
jgi:hypothetical protein